jgi:hypothetical protein
MASSSIVTDSTKGEILMSCRSFGLSSALLAAGLTLAACGSTAGDRGLSGAGIGAAAGTALGAVTGLGVVEGALIGAGAGGVTGALTDADMIDLGKPWWEN